MIKFFSKIRKKLAVENKIFAYSRYAIGEIVLVVIGILIALQINNWNEHRKEKVFEKKVLSELYMDVKEDIKEMKNALDSLEESQNSGRIIVQQLSNKQVYNDSLDKHFSFALRLWSLSPNTTSFDMAKAEGMYFITNDSIRFFISKVNGYQFDYIRVLENRFQDYMSNVVLPHIQPIFDSYNFKSMKPNDYESLINDTTYIGIIKSIITMREQYVFWLDERYSLLEKLLDMLQNEIK